MRTITREIQIDMAHRVPDHESKCRNLHGHRYVIQATLEGSLIPKGREKGMVMDFGFLKEAMMKAIDEPFDHGMALHLDDPIIRDLNEHVNFLDKPGPFEVIFPRAGLESKAYATADVPTAENLAALWFALLAKQLADNQPYYATLLRKIRVYETPNCWADYIVEPVVDSYHRGD